MSGEKRRLLVFLSLWVASLLAFAALAATGRYMIRAYFRLQPEAYRLRCEQLLKNGRYGDVERETLAAIRSNPYDFDAHYLLAESLRLRGDRAGAYEELGKSDEIARALVGRKALVIGYSPARPFYRMAMMDFEAGRFDQGTANLLRAIDEAPDCIADATKGLPSIRDYVAERFRQAKSSGEIVSLCRVLDAMGEQTAARQVLEKIAARDKASSTTISLVEAELNMLAFWSAGTESDLQEMIRATKKKIDGVLASQPDYYARLWATLLLGRNNTPAAPITDDVLDGLLGDRPVKVLKPRDLHAPKSMSKAGFFSGPLSFNLYQTGTVRGDFTLDRPVRALWVLARGTNAVRVWPYVIVRLDGREIGRLYLKQFAYRPYQIPVDAAAGPHSVELQFTNDEYEKHYRTDTNVYIRALVWMP